MLPLCRWFWSTLWEDPPLLSSYLFRHTTTVAIPCRFLHKDPHRALVSCHQGHPHRFHHGWEHTRRRGLGRSKALVHLSAIAIGTWSDRITTATCECDGERVCSCSDAPVDASRVAWRRHAPSQPVRRFRRRHCRHVGSKRVVKQSRTTNVCPGPTPSWRCAWQDTRPSCSPKTSC